MNKILKNNPYVQSPVWPEVETLLKDITVAQTYYPRGNKQATQDLQRVVDKHRAWIASTVNLDDFRYCYATAGATEAINAWRVSDKRPWQMLTGDYQWANMLTNDGEIVNELDPNKVLYISNPQCANGNYLDNDFLESIETPVIYDCAYIGAAYQKRISIPKNTEQVMFSFSKGWGLIGQRCGLLYTKKPHPVLDPLQKVECWNYSIPAIVEAIIDNFQPDSMYNHFRNTQIELCNKYNITPSDTYFIATSTDEYYEVRRRKGNEARLCLTPLIKN